MTNPQSTLEETLSSRSRLVAAEILLKCDRRPREAELIIREGLTNFATQEIERVKREGRERLLLELKALYLKEGGDQGGHENPNYTDGWVIPLWEQIEKIISEGLK